VTEPDDPFEELDALCESRRHAPRPEGDPGLNDEQPEEPAAEEIDLYAAEHRALCDLEVCLREVRRDMSRRQGRATAGQRERVRECWKVASLYYYADETELRETGFGAEDLEPPPPWWKIGAELSVKPAEWRLAGGDLGLKEQKDRDVQNALRQRRRALKAGKPAASLRAIAAEHGVAYSYVQRRSKKKPRP
jgi:hypothetical protein